MGATLAEEVLLSALLTDLLAQLDARNTDNIGRTASYLELYAYTIDHPPELPWLLMAHLVSRNAGYLMTDVARARARTPDAPWNELFLFLERANFLIFWDAWDHVLRHLAGLPLGERTPRFMREAWARSAASSERQLVLDLVHNEQHYIEARVVHNPRFASARQIVAFAEASGRDRPIIMPLTSLDIRVGEFASITRRIDTGRRIFDEVLAEPGRRRAIFDWALAHPHTGDRSVAGGKAGEPLRAGWPVDAVHALDPGIHAPPEPDPDYR